MKDSSAITYIFEALREAEEKLPGYPNDPVHAAAILVEEAGELMQAALDYYYGRAKTKRKMAREAAQAGAMALRFLLHLEHYWNEENAGSRPGSRLPEDDE
jgi:hypothetical protein